MPCACVPGRYAEPSHFQIGIAHPWSWAIGSSTSAAQRSFDYGQLPSESPAFRVEREMGASGQRPTIPEGNGAVARAFFEPAAAEVPRVHSVADTTTEMVRILGLSPVPHPGVAGATRLA